LTYQTSFAGVQAQQHPNRLSHSAAL